MKNYKRRVITWSILTVLGLIGIIVLSVLITQVQPIIDLNDKVVLDTQIIDLAQYVKAYSIGGLAFSCLIFVMGSIITYAGYKSLNYVEMFN
ncbi:hypothetical protein [Mycoplasmopsis verecunda]|uniref:Uncharacterized protein n=1 Tax=Mycoplasmopsis verecunda TaxID=171291 RepID=A0A1T4LNB2_9BACT|nr:hypothetical protein [Mycoplasmopsis verecunda]WPB54761.1 hypothetical protein SAM46_01220 [Mycoplasmopsis verecunda]SJZ55944.1 hypothetical protein SAMN02745154_00491 [Mycoplasmopsis verecunda]